MRPPDVQELLWSLFPISGAREQRLPRVEVRLGPSVPAWSLRAVAAVAAGGCTLLAGDATVWVAVAVALVVFVARPPGAVTGAVAAAAGLLLLTSGGVSPLRLAMLVFGLHLVVELTALAARLDGSARIERRVFVAAVRPFVAVQVAGQAAAAFAGQVTAQPPQVWWLPVAAGVALGGFAWLVAARMTARR